MIADDHELIREGLKRVLAGARQITRVAEAANAQQVIEQLRQDAWDLVILDLKLPGRSGLEVLKDLKREWPHLPVLVVSMYPEEQFAVRVIRAGADGYLTKSSASHDLLKAVESIRQGKRYISAKVAEELFEAIQKPADKLPHDTLSDREQDVFHLIAAGRTVGEIARQLNLSVKTISTYRANVLRKLAVENNSQIMRYALDHGLLE